MQPSGSGSAGSGFSANIFVLLLISLSLQTNDCLCEETILTNYELLYGRVGRVEGKIIGGKPVSIEKFPSAVLVFNFGSLCGGTIINSWTIISAAHCFTHNSDIEEITIHIGSRYIYDDQAMTHAVTDLKTHERYNKPIPFSNDLALLFLEEHIRLGKMAKKAVLANTNEFTIPNKNHFHATGWGWTKYGGAISKMGLMMTHLRVVESKACGKMHDLNLSPDMFCLYGNAKRDTCKGDSGGGVIWQDMLVGIVSHGEGCAKENKPSVYTNVWYLRKWIEKTVTEYLRHYCALVNSTASCY